MNIVIATGGSGGHVIPALKVAAALRKRNCEVRFTGSLKTWKERIAASGFASDELQLRGVSFAKPLALPKTFWLFAKGTWEAARLLKRYKTDVVVGFGGYGSFPVVLGAVLSRRPTLVHEQNVLPGKANAVLSRLVDKIAISFPQSRPYFPADKTVVTGCPSHVPNPGFDKRVLFKDFGLKEDKKTVLILGGSQGSRRINEVAVQVMGKLKDTLPVQVIHLCGKADYAHLNEKYAGMGIPFALFEFFEGMDRIYPLADLVVSRAGAVSVTELIRFRKPAIVIPYPGAGNHQKNNAEVLTAAGVGRLVEEKDFSAQWLSNTVQQMLAQQPQPAVWEQNFPELLANNSAESLAQVIIGMKR